jgi:hypothetical protein
LFENAFSRSRIRTDDSDGLKIGETEVEYREPTRFQRKLMKTKQTLRTNNKRFARKELNERTMIPTTKGNTAKQRNISQTSPKKKNRYFRQQLQPAKFCQVPSRQRECHPDLDATVLVPASTTNLVATR